MGVMTDTLTRSQGVHPDTGYRLTKAAVHRAKTRLNLRRQEDIAPLLGISRRSFYRLLDGTYPITLTKAADFSDLIDWPIHRAFTRSPM